MISRSYYLTFINNVRNLKKYIFFRFILIKMEQSSSDLGIIVLFTITWSNSKDSLEKKNQGLP